MRFLILVASLLLPGDWPQFRGPNSDGHSAEPSTPLQWSDTTNVARNNVAWKVAVPGHGWSSPSVADGRIFLTTAVPQGEGLSLRAMAFDAETGNVLWDREVRAVDTIPQIHPKNSHASPTPLVSEGSVFVHFGTLGTARLSAESGDIEWLNTEIHYNPMHGSGGSPVLCNGKLLFACDGTKDPFVAAVDAETGNIVWRTPRSVKAGMTHSFVTATVAIVDGRPLLMAPGPDHLAVYDVDTGEEVCRVLAKGWSVVPQPAIGHGLVFYNHDYDNPEMMAVRLGGTGDITETHVAWRIDRGAPSTPSPLLVGDELYFVSDAGIASCVDAKTGKRHWMERLGGNFSASPVLANGMILFLNETGEFTWVKTGTEFADAGHNQLPGRTFATPAFSDGAMFVRTEEFLYRIADR